jgi:hypothetical protein
MKLKNEVMIGIFECVYEIYPIFFSFHCMNREINEYVD